MPTPVTSPQSTSARTSPGSAISADQGLSAVAVTPNAATAYVVNAQAGSVTPIDVATNALGDPIDVNANPSAIAISPDGALAFVVNLGSNNVTLIDIATNAVVTEIAVGSEPSANRSHAGWRRGICDERRFERRHADRRRQQDRRCADPGRRGSVSDRHHTQRRGRLSSRTPSGRASPGSTSPRAPPAPPSSWTRPHGRSPSRPTARPPTWPARSPTLSRRSTSPPIPPALPSPLNALGPWAIAITPDGATAYVANNGSSNVTPINLTTRTAGSPIAAGTGPVAVAITPDQAPVAALSVPPGRPGTALAFDASASTVAFGTDRHLRLELRRRRHDDDHDTDRHPCLRDRRHVHGNRHRDELGRHLHESCFHRSDDEPQRRSSGCRHRPRGRHPGAHRRHSDDLHHLLDDHEPAEAVRHAPCHAEAAAAPRSSSRRSCCRHRRRRGRPHSAVGLNDRDALPYSSASPGWGWAPLA